MSGKVLVIGATGTIGSDVVAGLSQVGERIRAATRQPDGQAAKRVASGGAIEAVSFDFERPETFGSAIEGADRAFLIARPGDDESDRVALPLIDEMAKRGVRHIVNLTALGADLRDDTSLYRIERHLERSGVGWTHLRPNFFMQVFSTGSLQAGIRSQGIIGLPAADARISYVDARDISAVAVAALRDPERHAGRAYPLTGPESLSHEDVAHHISNALGRPIRYLPLDEDSARQALAKTFSPARVERLIGFYRAVREGACAPVATTVADVLGRPATPFVTFVRDFTDAWR